MIIYNTTFSVPKELQIEFIKYMREEYVPQALTTGIIKEPRLSRVFSNEEADGYSYALEFKAENIDLLEEWNLKVGKNLYFSLMKKFKQNIPGFTSVLQPVNLNI